MLTHQPIKSMALMRRVRVRHASSLVAEWVSRRRRAMSKSST